MAEYKLPLYISRLKEMQNILTQNQGNSHEEHHNSNNLISLLIEAFIVTVLNKMLRGHGIQSVLNVD